MALESATHISDLVVTNPALGDPLGQGDDHIRLLKLTLKTSFPNVNAPVTTSVTLLNSISALTDRATALETTRLRNNADQTTTGSLTISGSGKFLDAPTLKQAGSALVPTGVIVLWYGNTSNVPAGWQLCNGSNGTPDLRERFVLGAGTTAAHVTGGATSFSGTSGVAGAHDHGGGVTSSGSHSHTGTAATSGYHTHTEQTAGHALTIEQMPEHTHQEYVGQGGVGSGTGWIIYNAGSPAPSSLFTGPAGSSHGHTHGIFGDGNHTHSTTSNAAGDHTHAMSGVLGHTHTVAVTGVRPPFYTLAYIMKV